MQMHTSVDDGSAVAWLWSQWVVGCYALIASSPQSSPHHTWAEGELGLEGGLFGDRAWVEGMVGE